MFQIMPNTRGYDDLFSTMVEAVPSGTFYDVNLGRPIVMFAAEPTPFILQTDNPAYPVQITRQLLNPFHIGVDQGNLVNSAMVVPLTGSTQTTFYITLGQGLNRLTAQELLPSGGGRTFILEVIATTNTIIFESYGREIFVSSSVLDLQQEALYSPYSTSMFQQLTGVNDILPDLQTLKTLSTKMLIRAFIHFPATQLGIQNEIQGIALNTPIYQSQKASSNYHIETSSIMRSAENVAGQEAHVWFPNLAVTRWLAFTKMANNFSNNFALQSVRDDYVTVLYKGKSHLHYFDYEAFGQNFLTNLSLTNCFDNISMTYYTVINSRMFVPCWTYPFDYSVTQATAIGQTRGTFDSGVPFDSGIPFDADPVDPFSDGWVGWSLSGRFDQGPPSYPLDSMVQPALSMALTPGPVNVLQQTPLTEFYAMPGSDFYGFAVNLMFPATISTATMFLLLQSSSGSGNIVAQIWVDVGGIPGTLLAASTPVPSTDLPTAVSSTLNEGTEITFNFVSPPSLQIDQQYWLVLATAPAVELLVGVGTTTTNNGYTAENTGSGWVAYATYLAGFFKLIGMQIDPPTLFPTSYQGPYTQSLDSFLSKVFVEELVTASGVMSDYADSSPDITIVGLGIDFPNTPAGEVEDVEDEEYPTLALRVFQAGVPVLLCVKYVDANNMTNLAGNGIIQIIEPLTNSTEYAPVSAGFVYIYYTPTVSTTYTVFNMADIANSLTGTSQPFQVTPGPLVGLSVTSIADQAVGVPFSVTVKAVDAYGNVIPNVGPFPILHINAQLGFAGNDPTPNLVTLINGQATFNLTMNTPGTGTLLFSLNLLTVTSNQFTVS